MKARRNGNATSLLNLFSVSGDKKSLMMDYLPQMRTRLTSPLVKQQPEGVPEVIDFMDKYDINREDFDNILDITSWPHLRDPMTSVETKVCFLAN